MPEKRKNQLIFNIMSFKNWGKKFRKKLKPNVIGKGVLKIAKKKKEK